MAGQQIDLLWAWFYPADSLLLWASLVYKQDTKCRVAIGYKPLRTSLNDVNLLFRTGLFDGV